MPRGDDSKKVAPRRRWFQFSLRWLLVLCIVLSLPLGYIGWRIHRGRRIHEVVLRLQERGYQLRGYGLPAMDWAVIWGPHGKAVAESPQDNVPITVATDEADPGEWEETAGPGRISPFPINTSCYLEAAPQPPKYDPLWMWGFGSRLFGEATFARPIELSEIDGRGNAFAIWRLIEEIPELEELDLRDSTQRLLESSQAVPTLHRLRNLKQLRLANVIDDAFLDLYQPPPSLQSLKLSGVDGSGASWQRFFARSHITELHLDKPARPKKMLAAAKSLRSLAGIHVTDCTLDDETLKVLFALEPSGSLIITRSRIPEGDDRARQRLAAAGLNVEDLYFHGPDWKAFREEHWELLLGDDPQHFVHDDAGATP